MQVPRTNALESISEIEKTAHPPAQGAIARARDIARLVEHGEFPMPFVFPTEIGGIQFEWKGSERELNLEILPEREHLAFLEIVEGAPVLEGEITQDVERSVRALLDWMVSR
jgi:hypothetical protein